MNKKIQPETREATFKCASCGSEFKMMTTAKDTNITLDVCSKCHPFYVGGSGQQAVKGRAEKMSNKFATGLQNINSKNNKTEKNRVKKEKNIVKSLEELEAK